MKITSRLILVTLVMLVLLLPALAQKTVASVLNSPTVGEVTAHLFPVSRAFVVRGWHVRYVLIPHPQGDVFTNFYWNVTATRGSTTVKYIAGLGYGPYSTYSDKGFEPATLFTTYVIKYGE